MAMVWRNYEKNKVFGLFPPGGYKRLNCRELNCRRLNCRWAQLSVGSTVGSSTVGSSTVGRLNCRGSTVGAQLSQAQLSVNRASDICVYDIREI